MSAFIVSNEHINYIVNAATFCGREKFAYWDYEEDRRKELNNIELGQLLWDENHKSVNYRYGENTVSPRYAFKIVPFTDKLQAIKLVNSLEYQSCEHEGWLKSEARKVCQALVSDFVRKLPEYNEKEWSI